MAYTDFAYVYDTLMQDVDYARRTDYILSLFKKFGSSPSLILDVACGTGNFSVELAKRGIDVIAADMSEDMLAVARDKSAFAGLNILYLCQRAEELNLYGTVDAAVCLTDSINHITDPKLLKKAFKKISLFLEPRCLFIFDVNTPYKHEHILGDNTFVLEESPVYCVWQNRYSKKSRITDISLDFFTCKDGLYTRTGEAFCERAYTVDELTRLLQGSGFKIEAVFDDMSESPLSDTSQRAIFVCRKIN